MNYNESDEFVQVDITYTAVVGCNELKNFIIADIRCNRNIA